LLARSSRELAAVSRFLVATFLTFFACASPCQAQWTFAVYGGAVHTPPADLTIIRHAAGMDVTFPATPFHSQSLDAPVYYGYRIGRALHRDRVFIEAELIHAKAFAKIDAGTTGSGVVAGRQVNGVPVGSVVQQFAMSHGLNFVLANVAFRQPLMHRGVAVTARIGVGPMVPHGETEIEGRRREGYQQSGIGVQTSGGIELPVWRALRCFLEYKFTHARPRLSVDGGIATATLRSHHVAAGASLLLAR
jgi:hypothetical protein